MARTILVPLDGSPEAESVLPVVSRVLSPLGKVHLLHLLPSDSAPPGIDYLDRVRRRSLPGSPGLDLVRSEAPADGILRAALEKNIDLIAMTTHARRGLPRMLLGSVAAEVVRKSQLPVLLARPDMVPCARRLRRVLVPIETDGIPPDLLETLKFLCPDAGQEVVLLRVIPPEKQPAVPWALQQLADQLEEEGFTVWPITATGEAADQILAHGKKLEADLIAMTTHARAGLERLLEGSVAEQILRRSPVAVLLQKPLVLHQPKMAGEAHA